MLVLRYKEPDRPRPFRVPFAWPVCVLSAAGCLFIMYGLPATAWERFGWWLVIGLVLYFSYGFSHSKLRAAHATKPGAKPGGPLRLCVRVLRP